MSGCDCETPCTFCTRPDLVADVVERRLTPDTPLDICDEKCTSCGRRRPLVELTLPDGAGTFRMCTTCAADHIREVGAERIKNLEAS